MRHITCSGPTPYDIGSQHGSAAKTEIHRCIQFYRTLFEKTAHLDWEDVLKIADKFDEIYGIDGIDGGDGHDGESGGQEDEMRGLWRDWREEMRGIAKGADVPYRAILALNVRTEVAYGMSQDGCTALSWKTNSTSTGGGTSFLAQNWDWQEEQRQNLIHLQIHRRSQEIPAISMITEAGIIGKIGLNEKGVGVCLNAIGAVGVDFARVPTHLALRSCLEGESAAAAADRLKRLGVASACHILVADEKGGVGLECSSQDVVPLLPDSHGIVTHTNHFVKRHVDGVQDKITLKDSPLRLQRLEALVQEHFTVEKHGDGKMEADAIQAFLKDEMNSPTSICRSPSKESTMATLFSIVMDLTKVKAGVTIGRPSQAQAEILRLDPLSN